MSSTSSRANPVSVGYSVPVCSRDNKFAAKSRRRRIYRDEAHWCSMNACPEFVSCCASCLATMFLTVCVPRQAGALAIFVGLFISLITVRAADIRPVREVCPARMNLFTCRHLLLCPATNYVELQEGCTDGNTTESCALMYEHHMHHLPHHHGAEGQLGNQSTDATSYPGNPSTAEVSATGCI